MKINIRQRVFRLLLVSSAMTFFVLVAVLIFGMLSIRYNLNTKSDVLSEYSTGYIQEVMQERSKIALETLAKDKAEYIERELFDRTLDVKLFAELMHGFLSLPPSDISRRDISNPMYQTIQSGEPYISYTPELRARGISSAIQAEIDRSSNISDLLIPLGERYKGYESGFFVASKNGYYIALETTSDGSDVPFEEDYFLNYDFQKRPWYMKGKDSKEPTFTEVYADMNGVLGVSCVMSYEDGNGDFAGVISIAYGIPYIYEVVINTAVGDDGFSFILDSAGDIIVSGKNEGIFAVDKDYFDLRTVDDAAISETAKQMTAGETGVTAIEIDGEKYYVAFAPIPASGWSFATLMSRTTVLAPAIAARDEIKKQMIEFREEMAQFFINTFIAASVLFALLLAWMFFRSSKVAKRFVEPINTLTAGVKEISGGNLDKKIEVQTGDELEELANSFNTMTDELKNYMQNLTKVTAEKEKIATEINVAKDIQLSALPHDFLEDCKEIEIFATMHAAKGVGGDFYDFYKLDENHLVITIADVSGKGIPAALFMMRSKTILKNLAMTMSAPDELAAVMTLANNQLCQNNDEMMFVTVFFGMLDTKTGKFIFVNGGHNPPTIYRKAENKFEYLQVEENCVLGMMEDLDFVQQEINLAHGDIIYLYTDGVTEAMNKDNEQYGEARLENCLNNIDPQCKLQTLLEGVKKSLAEHVQDAEQSDDITMLAVRLK